MIIHRSQPPSRFTIIPDEALRDPRLTYRARGVLAEILSRPDDWDTTADAMWRRARSERGAAGEGRDALRAAFAELEVAGYLYRSRHRVGGGRCITELHVFDAMPETLPDGTPVSLGSPARVSAGGTDDETGSRRPDQGQQESPQVAPTYGLPGVGSPGVGSPGVGPPGVYTETYNGDLTTETENSSLSLGKRLSAAVPDATEREIARAITEISDQMAAGRIHSSERAYLQGIIANGDARGFVADVIAKRTRDGLIANGHPAVPARPEYQSVAEATARAIPRDPPPIGEP